ncbi:MAG: hypothetical protein NTW74_01910 [Acidobacteria bacterium]|nr:hypothetical protein [Acidobacteriota bacterium]
MRNAILLLILASSACADFSYTTTIKRASPAAAVVTRHQIKGNKMKIDTGSTIIISDLDTQTITTINLAARTYRVSPGKESAAALSKVEMNAEADVFDTGEHKKIRDLNCSQLIVSMIKTGPGKPIYVEHEIWVSTDVPGANEWKAIGLKMAEKGLLPASADARSIAMLSDLQKQIAKVSGMPVLQITRMKSADDEELKRVYAAMQTMEKTGSKEAEEILSQFKRMRRSTTARYIAEINSDSSAFSTATIPESEFSIPPGFKKIVQ